jgi:hypothetical protein
MLDQSHQIRLLILYVEKFVQHTGRSLQWNFDPSVDNVQIESMSNVSIESDNIVVAKSVNKYAWIPLLNLLDLKTSMQYGVTLLLEAKMLHL